MYKTPRQRDILHDEYEESINYILIDIDDVKTKEASESIVRYLKNTNYKINVFSSRSYNRKKF